MCLRLLKLFALLALCGLSGCQSPQPTTATPERAEPVSSGKKSFDAVTRNNSLALLDELLNEEKNLSKILIIKSASPKLKRLVKDISAAAGTNADLLKLLMEKDPSLQLPGNGLPPGEKATRDAISKTKEHLLLHTKGVEFELQLLLTQSEALNYGVHLALVAADNESQPERARQFSSLSTQLKQLHEQVVAMLRTK
jgi:hypothetical protein